MKRVLFISNGHGEISIAAHIARALAGSGDVQADHLAIVGDQQHTEWLNDVGPRRAMPSGGLIAMGNFRNWWSDLRGGLAAHTLAQVRFLLSIRRRYAAAVAVGDVLALLFAKLAAAQHTVFVGTAKSVFVAPYGPAEERVIKSADAVFVRDEPTALRLRDHAVAAQAANVIAELFSSQQRPPAHFEETLALFPGSREQAYADARFLADVVRELHELRPSSGAWLSIAPTLDANRFAAMFARDGWEVVRGDERSPFTLCKEGRVLISAWCGEPGALLESARVVLGQAGTANEAAAACGLPVIAFAAENTRANEWYRRRQRGLLGDAMRVVDGNAHRAAAELDKLLNDPATLASMASTGKSRMEAGGGTQAIVAAIRGLLG